MSLMISGGGGGYGAGASGGPGRAAGSLRRGRGTAVGAPSATAVSLTRADAPWNIGAGCEPDCRNSTLTTMAIATQAPRTKPTASRAFQPSALNRRVTRLPSRAALFSRSARAMGLCTAPRRAQPQRRDDPFRRDAARRRPLLPHRRAYRTGKTASHRAHVLARTPRFWTRPLSCLAGSCQRPLKRTLKPERCATPGVFLPLGHDFTVAFPGHGERSVADRCRSPQRAPADDGI